MFHGAMTALITPFRNGKVDYAALEKIIALQIESGISGLVPCGSTGESATLTHDEHTEVVRFVVKTVAGRVPVIAGTGSNSTTEAVSLTRGAKEAGADAALLISPYYNKPTQDGIYAHYEKIAEETQFPLIVYNIPGRTGSKIEPATIARLADVDHIVGLKESTGSLDDVQEVARLCGDRLEIYSGDDSLTLPIMAAGGCGVISVVSNLIPERCVEVTAACARGDFATARQHHFRMLPLIRALFLETNPIPVKAAMAMLGLCQNELRLPLLPMSDTPRATLRLRLKEAGLL